MNVGDQTRTDLRYGRSRAPLPWIIGRGEDAELVWANGRELSRDPELRMSVGLQNKQPREKLSRANCKHATAHRGNRPEVWKPLAEIKSGMSRRTRSPLEKNCGKLDGRAHRKTLLPGGAADFGSSTGDKCKGL